ncbi:MAG: DUF3320 domain-containing protein [Candidatus Micrarchaeota archaeon]|nr:DUF3320 domain-containing protein [Candidatus Micrarchaeota archaeon]
MGEPEGEATSIQQKIEKKIELWKGKLLDISLRNKLINFKDGGNSCLRLSVKSPEAFYDELLSGTAKFFFAKSSSTDQKPNVLRSLYNDAETYRRLYQIYLTSNESLSEQGVNTLYLTFGYLEYESNEEGNGAAKKKARSRDEAATVFGQQGTTALKAPLVLVPVRIERRKEAARDKHPFSISFLDDDIHINPALRQKILQQNNIDIDFPFETLSEYLGKLSEEVKKFGWKVTSEDVYLGIFSFQKLSLYRDLELNRERITKHPVVRALVGDRSALAQQAFESIDTDMLDPKESFFVLDADSSQQEAIIAARKGLSFVLQGPPGTGKSQTIANIIAQQLADGKKVLFVSEKMAALEVVKKRLDAAGIGTYLLELHNADTAGKKWVLEQFEKALVENKLYASNEQLIDQLKEARAILKAYGNELVGDERGPLPLYRILGRLARLEHVKISDIGLSVRPDFSEFQRNMHLMEELDLYEKQQREFNTSILRYVNHKNFRAFTDFKQETLKELIGTAIEVIQHIKEESDQLEDKAGLYVRRIVDFKQMDNKLSLLIRQPKVSYRIKEEWFSIGIDDIIMRLNKYATKSSEHAALRKYLLSKYRENLLSHSYHELEDMVSKLDGLYSVKVVRWVDPRYKKISDHIHALLLEKANLTHEEMANDIRKAILCKRIWDELCEEAREIKGIIKEERLEVEELQAVFSWIRSLKSIEGMCNGRLIRSVCAGLDLAPLAQKFIAHANTLTDSYLAISEFFETEASERLLLSASWERLEERLEHILQNAGEISKWVEFKVTLDKLTPELRRVFDKCMTIEGRNYKVSELYEKIFLQECLSSMDADIARKSREYLDMVYAKFVESDKEHKFYSRNRIIEMIEAKKPKISLTSRSSEVGILSKEISKSRRHKPLRKLFSEIKNLVFVLKPCFMMSPLSVARFIDPDVIEFDTVIFDEASQVMVEDAISSIIRSKQVIIVGDSKQLPPTMFFKVNEGIDVEEGLEEAASILDEASAALPTHMLRWHYRSRDESLINFSNTHFYNGDLITFPNNQVDSFAIDFTYVRNGVYERGGSRQNRVEARKVVELIKQHFDTTPEKSLGVIAFSIAQQQAILEELDHFLTWHPSYQKLLNGSNLRGFFVKNLETVQGDERDVIILSIGYGRDADGNLSLNFGPLNKEGGVRRLNVAISRAIERVKVVSSILPEDISEARVSSEGILLLKKYLQYARAGESLHKRQNEFDSELQEAVYRKLTSYGLIAEKNIGSSRFNIDIAIRESEDSNRYLLAVELDGKAYSSAKSTRDRDRLRREMLESLGWKVHRIWSYDWVLNPEKEVERIIELINKQGGQAPRQKGDDEGARQRQLIANNELSFAIKEYPTIVCPLLGSPDDFMKTDFFNAIRDVIKSEGPIHKDLLMKRIFECYGVKDGTRARNRFDEILGLHLPSQDIFIEGDIYWASEPRFMFNIRRSDAEIRPLNLIPMPEIRLAVLLVVSNAISIAREDIPREVLAIFGAPKITPKFKGRVGVAIDELIEKGYLSEDSGKIIIDKEFQKKAEESQRKEHQAGTTTKAPKEDDNTSSQPPLSYKPHLPGDSSPPSVVF